MKLMSFESLRVVSYSPSIVTMALSCIVCEILVENREIFIPHRWNFAKLFDTHKTRMIVLLYGEKNYNNMLSRFHTIPERNGRTDGTELLYQYCVSVC